MNRSSDLRAIARNAWIEARDSAQNAQDAARVAEDIANLRLVEYAEIAQPKFASFYRRLLKRQPNMEGRFDEK